MRRTRVASTLAERALINVLGSSLCYVEECQIIFRQRVESSLRVLIELHFFITPRINHEDGYTPEEAYTTMYVGGKECMRAFKNFFNAMNKLCDVEVDINPNLLSILLLYNLSHTFENFRCAIESHDSLSMPDD